MKHYPVQVGFAGVAAEWLEELPTLQRQLRMRISAVYDATPALGAQGAERFQAAHLKGFLQLLNSPLVDAVVVANAGWLGWHAVLQCLKRGLPTLVVLSRIEQAAFFDTQLPELIRLEEALSYARSDHGFLMPGLPLRWLPATIRVRELTATTLGAIEKLQVTTQDLPLRSRELAEVLDWCLSVVQSVPERIQVLPLESGWELVLACRRRQRDAQPVEIHVLGAGDRTGAHSSLRFRAQAQCRHGTFQFESPAIITHTADRAPVEEHLTADRSAYDVMLDLFGRRLVGGVVPVPDFSDVLRVRNLILSAQLSQDQHEAIAVNEHGTSH